MKDKIQNQSAIQEHKIKVKHIFGHSDPTAALKGLIDLVECEKNYDSTRIYLGGVSRLGVVERVEGAMYREKK